MDHSNQFLGTERIGKLMAQYAVPCMISLLVGALYNIVDPVLIFAGHGKGGGLHGPVHDPRGGVRSGICLDSAFVFRAGWGFILHARFRLPHLFVSRLSHKPHLSGVK